jgi:hypothetical protein
MELEKIRKRDFSIPFFPYGKCQAIGITVLRNPCTKNLFRLLDAFNILLDHSFMEVIKIRDAETRTALSRRFQSMILVIRI